MTIKKLGLSAVAAAMVTTTAFAGVLSVDGNKITASQELLSLAAVDANVTNAILFKTSGMTYGTAAEAGWELIFPTNSLNEAAANYEDLAIAHNDTNLTVAIFDRVDGDSIIFGAVATTSVQRNTTYKIVSNDTNTTHSNTDAIEGTTGDLLVSLPKDATSFNVKLQLSDNTGVNPLDDDTENLLSVVEQYKGSYKTKLDAEIDAAESFSLFYNNTGSGSDSTTQDSYSFEYTDIEGDLNFAAESTKVQTVVFSDVNLSNYGVAVDEDITDFTTTPYDRNITSLSTALDTNGTYGYGAAAGTKAIQLSVTPVTDFEMDEVTFTASSYVTYTNGTISKTKALYENVDAGEWGIFGYRAQVPNVSNVDGSIETIFNIVNRSNDDQNVFITIYNATTGESVTLSSLNGDIASIAKDTTGVYKSGDLISESGLTGTKFAVEITVPTTPSDVYTHASFRNYGGTNLVFKDLPVYNNSTMSY